MENYKKQFTCCSHQVLRIRQSLIMFVNSKGSLWLKISHKEPFFSQRYDSFCWFWVIFRSSFWAKFHIPQTKLRNFDPKSSTLMNENLNHASIKPNLTTYIMKFRPIQTKTSQILEQFSIP